MIRTLSACMLVLTVSTAQAQDIDVSKKTGLVTVDGKEAFYIIKRSGSQFSIQNLEQKEIMYVQSEQVGQYYAAASRTMQPEMGFRYTFVATGNSAIGKSTMISFNSYKIIANTIVKARLLEGSGVNADAERRFIASNSGTFHTVEQAPVVVQVSAPEKPAAAPAVLVRNNKIYNHEEGVGSFKRSEEDKFEVIRIYNNSGELSATARHEAGSADADWSIELTDGKKTSLLYNAAAPLERLFTFMLEKGYLKS